MSRVWPGKGCGENMWARDEANHWTAWSDRVDAPPSSCDWPPNVVVDEAFQWRDWQTLEHAEERGTVYRGSRRDNALRRLWARVKGVFR